jgi:ribosomal protein S18 acetylase RimI-like enzyme
VAIIIREATIADVEAIAQVHVDSWRVAYSELIPAEIVQRWSLEQRVRQWRTIIGDAAASSRVQVGLLNDEVIGFVSAGVSDQPEAGDLAQVFALYVTPRHWRVGAGRQLLAAATEQLRTARFAQAILWVLQDNARARSFYDQAGWQLDGVSQTLGATDIVEVRYRLRLA